MPTVRKENDSADWSSRRPKERRARLHRVPQRDYTDCTRPYRWRAFSDIGLATPQWSFEAVAQRLLNGDDEDAGIIGDLPGRGPGQEFAEQIEGDSCFHANGCWHVASKGDAVRFGHRRNGFDQLRELHACGVKSRTGGQSKCKEP